jgi:DNA-binding transcriptional MerR regulator
MVPDRAAVMDTAYSTDQVCALAGITYRTLDYWIRRGIVTPSVAADGSGSARRFTRAEVDEVCLAATLRALGLELDRVGDLLAAARDVEPWSRDGAAIIATADRIEVEHDPELIGVDVARLGGAALVVVLPRS